MGKNDSTLQGIWVFTLRREGTNNKTPSLTVVRMISQKFRSFGGFQLQLGSSPSNVQLLGYVQNGSQWVGMRTPRYSDWPANGTVCRVTVSSRGETRPCRRFRWESRTILIFCLPPITPGGSSVGSSSVHYEPLRRSTSLRDASISDALSPFLASPTIYGNPFF